MRIEKFSSQNSLNHKDHIRIVYVFFVTVFPIYIQKKTNLTKEVFFSIYCKNTEWVYTPNQQLIEIIHQIRVFIRLAFVYSNKI